MQHLRIIFQKNGENLSALSSKLQLQSAHGKSEGKFNFFSLCSDFEQKVFGLLAKNFGSASKISSYVSRGNSKEKLPNKNSWLLVSFSHFQLKLSDFSQENYGTFSKLHSRCRYNFFEGKQVSWEQKHFYTLSELEGKPIGLLANFSHGFLNLVFGVQWESCGNPNLQKTKLFSEFEQKICESLGEKISRVQKISRLLRVELFELKQVVFGRS